MMAPNVLALGEILWDVIGDERHLGGAPFNFAAHTFQFGAESAIVSRVGEDMLGDKALERAYGLGVDTSPIQRDPDHPTGQVHVTLDEAGKPTFKIQTEVAYDYIEITPEARAQAEEADVVCFGTLAQRHSVSRQTIGALLEAATGATAVCDLNLRPPHYSELVIRESLAHCDVLKLNDDELDFVQDILGKTKLDQDPFLRHLLQAYEIDLICVTLGAAGCLLRTPEDRVESPGYDCQVVDTVGSGDAFTAALIAKLMADRPLEEVADFANLVGAYVATQPGATPAIGPEALDAFAAGRARSGQ